VAIQNELQAAARLSRSCVLSSRVAMTTSSGVAESAAAAAAAPYVIVLRRAEIRQFAAISAGLSVSGRRHGRTDGGLWH